MAGQHRRQLIDWSAEDYNAAIVGFDASRIAGQYRAPRGDKVSATDAGVLFIFIPLGAR
jgi:hypothetical protein